MTQLVYTEEELFRSHDYAKEHNVAGHHLHGGFDADGSYVPPRALIRVEGWTTFDHRYVPIGGILADIKANRRVEIESGVKNEGDRIIVRGCLEPRVEGVPVTVEFTDERGQHTYLHALTDPRGCFDLSKHEGARFPPGRYQVQSFVTAGADAAETSSPVRQVEVMSS